MLPTLAALASLAVAVAGGSASRGHYTPYGTQPSQSKVSNQISAHPDGQCLKGLSNVRNTFDINRTQDFPSYTTLHQPTFPGTEPKNGSGWDVWWHIPKPDAGCRFIMMLPYRQSSGTPGFPAGNEIINAGREGCYFGNVPTSSDVFLSYCCGSDECTRASLNSTSLLSTPQRRDTTAPVRSTVPRSSANSRLTQWMSNIRIPMLSRSSGSAVASHGGSTAAKAGALVSRYWYIAPPTPPPADCKLVNPGQPYSRAGQQVVVSSSQSCIQGPCMVSLAFQVMSSTTAISSKAQTLSLMAGRSTMIAGGVDFLGGMMPEVRTEMARAITTATGQMLMSGNSTTITTTVSLKLGNRGVVTYTPVFRCTTASLDCGGGLSDPIDFCQPDMSGPGGSPLGDYYPLISD